MEALEHGSECPRRKGERRHLVVRPTGDAGCAIRRWLGAEGWVAEPQAPLRGALP